MKKSPKILRRTAAAALTGALMCGSMLAGATVASKQMEAQYSDIKIVVNGIEVTPTDADGNPVEPFASEGTTYLPLRAIANALGLPVTWDGATKTAYLGDIPGQETNWMLKLPPYQSGTTGNGSNVVTLYDGSDQKSYFTVSGVNYLTGMTFTCGSAQALMKTYAVWNTNLEYNTMTFTMGNVDGYQKDVTMEVYLDGEFSGISYDLRWDEPPKTYSIPLNHAASVKLVFGGSGQYGPVGYGMYDISFE